MQNFRHLPYDSTVWESGISEVGVDVHKKFQAGTEKKQETSRYWHENRLHTLFPFLYPSNICNYPWFNTYRHFICAQTVSYGIGASGMSAVGTKIFWETRDLLYLMRPRAADGAWVNPVWTYNRFKARASCFTDMKSRMAGFRGYVEWMQAMLCRKRPSM